LLLFNILEKKVGVKYHPTLCAYNLVDSLTEMLKDTCTIDFNDAKINFVSKNIPPRHRFTAVL